MLYDLTNKPPAENNDLIHIYACYFMLQLEYLINVLTIGHYLVSVLTVDLITVGTGGAFSSKDI